MSYCHLLASLRMRAKMPGIKSDSVNASVDELAKSAIISCEMAVKCANHKNFHPRKCIMHKTSIFGIIIGTEKRRLYYHDQTKVL